MVFKFFSCFHLFWMYSLHFRNLKNNIHFFFRQSEEDFGLVLSNSNPILDSKASQNDIMTAGFYVERVLPASTADRCGALSIGK